VARKYKLTKGSLARVRDQEFEWPLADLALPEHEKMAGVKALMMAIIIDVIDCLFGESTVLRNLPKRVVVAQAVQYISSKNDSWFFSFENCCNVLEIDPIKLRSRLLAKRALQQTRLRSTRRLLRTRVQGTKQSQNISVARER